MLTNPALKDMSDNDLSRRYSNSYIKYNDDIVYVNELSRSFLTYTKKNVANTKPFKWDRLDCSRPYPRWVEVNNKHFYVAYQMERQFTRGFCAESSIVWSPSSGNIRFPSNVMFGILAEFYQPPMKRKRQTLGEVLAQIEQAPEGVLLSPQVLLYKNRGDKNDVLVYYRENCLGNLKQFNVNFEEELKELIGDYDANDARLLQIASSKPAPRAGREGVGDFIFRNQRVVEAAHQAVEQRRVDEREFDWAAIERLLAQ